jgi:hypothetical protein
MVGGVYQVSTVDIDSASVEPSIAIGVIKQKPTDITCVVHLLGPLAIAPFAGMIPGRRVFVGTSGEIIDTTPAEPASGQKRILQRVGYVLADGVVMVNPDEPIQMRAP